MDYEKITVTLNANQVKEAIKEKLRKEFPHHNFGDIITLANGSVEVSLKTAGNYMDR